MDLGTTLHIDLLYFYSVGSLVYSLKHSSTMVDHLSFNVLLVHDLLCNLDLPFNYWSLSISKAYKGGRLPTTRMMIRFVS